MNQYLLPGSNVLTAVNLIEEGTDTLPKWQQVDIDFSDCACSPLPTRLRSNLLDEIVNSFNSSELTTLCYVLGISYEDLAGDTRTDKVRELIEHHERRKRLPALLEGLRAQRPEVNWSLYQEQNNTAAEIVMANSEEIQPEVVPQENVVTSHATTNDNEETLIDLGDIGDITEPQEVCEMLELEFINRSREIEYITNPARQPVMLIDAPAGYGKSAILSALRKKFEGDDWHYVLINLNECQGNVAQKLTGVPNANHAKWVFLFDVAEQATDTDLEYLLKEYLLGCKNTLPRDGFRAIFAGRYIEYNTGVAKWIGVEKMHLSPFSQQVVEKMIEKTLSRTSDRLESRQTEILAKTIIELSGGHPRSIRNLIDRLAEQKWKIPVTRSEKQELFKSCTAREISLVTDKLRDDTRNNLESVFVFRRFNLKTLKFLQQQGAISEGIDVLQILSELSQKRLVAREEGSIFYSDQIVRDLILARLRLFEPERYRLLNQIAHDLYKRWIEYELERPDIEGSPISSSDLIPILVSENIYHICQQYPQSISAVDIAAQCIRKNGDYLARALGESSGGNYHQKHLKDLVMKDDNVRAVFEDRGLSIDVVFEIAFHSRQQDRNQTRTQSSIGIKMAKRHIYDWLVDTLDFLRRNAQHVLIERWEKRNLGHAVTPPVFVDGPMPREQLVQTLPKGEVLQQNLNSYQDASGQIILINEEYVTNLRKQMEQAQRTIGRYELSRNKALSENEKIQLEEQIDEYQERFDETAEKLADIYVYLYSE